VLPESKLKYLCLTLGVGCLYYAWRGTIPDGDEIGRPMRARTRYVYVLGGLLLTGLAIVLWRS
jgi:hypothetical protein